MKKVFRSKVMSYDELEVFKKMITLFENIEVKDIFNDDYFDEDGEVLWLGYGVIIEMAYKNVEISEILLRAFMFEEQGAN